jgi:hypothetical protein
MILMFYQHDTCIYALRRRRSELRKERRVMYYSSARRVSDAGLEARCPLLLLL